MVVDEGHLVASLGRGLQLELLLTRLRQRSPDTRLLFLSALLPNLDEIGAWLEPHADGDNTVASDWSPSRLQTGVFRWTGPARDGQTGKVRYVGTGDDFFVPHVLVRNLRRTKLFPDAPKDVAAALALHYLRQGPVLIGAATKPSARGAARALDAALRKAPDRAFVDPGDAAELAAVAATIASVVGSDHELTRMVVQGFGYHHADVPEQARAALEAAFRSGALKVLCATSTLSQGVNLPAKTVIVSSTWRGQGDRISVREFWNLAGRAGRAFGETEGHVILVAKNSRDASELARRYLDRDRIEPVNSVLYRLFRAIAQARLRTGMSRVPPGADLGEHPLITEHEQLLALDGQLLALAAEELVDTADEEAIAELLGVTLCAVQLERNGAPMRPFARYVSRRMGR